MKRFIRVLWRFIRAYLFYPFMIGLFLWLYVKGAHWIFGLMVISAIFILDPIWRHMAGNLIKMWRRRKAPPK